MKLLQKAPFKLQDPMILKMCTALFQQLLLSSILLWQQSVRYSSFVAAAESQ